MRSGRPKDLEFCRALLDLSLVSVDRLRERLAMVVTLDPRVRTLAAARIPAELRQKLHQR